MRPRLTERQNKALAFIRAHIRQHSRPPTLKEIGGALGIASTNGASKLVSVLEKKGFIEREANVARGISLVHDDEGDLAEAPLPLMVISRGDSRQPEQMRHRPAGYFSVDPYFLRGVEDEMECFIARVGDDGMSGDGLNKGDFVIVEGVPHEALRNGEMVAVLVGEEIRVRRYHFVNDRVHLLPAAPHYAEEVYAPDDPAFFIAGRLIGLMRRLE